MAMTSESRLERQPPDFSREAPTAFAKFDAREEGYIKVVLKLA
jgi:hypothetical protein